MSTRALQIGAVVIGIIAIVLAGAYVVNAGDRFLFNPERSPSTGVLSPETSALEIPANGSASDPRAAQPLAQNPATGPLANTSVTIQPPPTGETAAVQTQPAQSSATALQQNNANAPAVLSAQGYVEQGYIEEANPDEQSESGSESGPIVESSLPAANSRTSQRSAASPSGRQMSLAQQQTTSIPAQTVAPITATIPSTPAPGEQPTENLQETATPERPDFRATLDALTGETGVTPEPAATAEGSTPTVIVVSPQPTLQPTLQPTAAADTADDDGTPQPATATVLPAATSADDTEASNGETVEDDAEIQIIEPDATLLDRPDFRATLDAVTGNVTATPTPMVITQPDGATKGQSGASLSPGATMTTVPGETGIEPPTAIVVAGSEAAGQPVAIAPASLYLAPSFDTEIVGTVEAGQLLIIVARLTTGEWFLLNDGSWINANNVANGPGALPLVVPTPTSTSTQTPTPTGTPPPTSTSELPPTPTPTPTSLDEVICACESDQYECLGSSFSVQAEAQACFEYCFRETGRDIHNLDPNENGMACENLE